jgi:hypothetical protein
MRNEVAQWLLEVAELEECCGSVFPGAVQLFDRYLSKVTILPCQLQVTAITCLLIISKSTYYNYLESHTPLFLSL